MAEEHEDLVEIATEARDVRHISRRVRHAFVRRVAHDECAVAIWGQEEARCRNTVRRRSRSGEKLATTVSFVTGAISSARLFALSHFARGKHRRLPDSLIGWHAFALTGRALDLGYVALAQFVPAIGLSLIPFNDEEDSRTWPSPAARVASLFLHEAIARAKHRDRNPTAYPRGASEGQALRRVQAPKSEVEERGKGDPSRIGHEQSKRQPIQATCTNHERDNRCEQDAYLDESDAGCFQTKEKKGPRCIQCKLYCPQGKSPPTRLRARRVFVGGLPNPGSGNGDANIEDRPHRPKKPTGRIPRWFRQGGMPKAGGKRSAHRSGRENRAQENERDNNLHLPCRNTRCSAACSRQA